MGCSYQSARTLHECYESLANDCMYANNASMAMAANLVFIADGTCKYATSEMRMHEQYLEGKEILRPHLKPVSTSIRNTGDNC